MREFSEYIVAYSILAVMADHELRQQGSSSMRHLLEVGAQHTSDR